MKQSHQVSRHKAERESHASSGAAPAAATGHDGGKETLIREAAYYRYLARGAEVGHDLDDWLQAESQLLDEEDSKQTSH